MTPSPHLSIKENWRTKLALSVSALLPKHSKTAAKIRRLAYGKELKHMRNVSSKFSLSLCSNNQTYDIFWNGNNLGTTSPLPTAINDNEIWLMATGPSVKELDFSQLKNKTIMGLNGAIANCEEHGLTPEFYAITDRDFFEHRMHLVEKAVLSGAHCFFSFNGIARICELAPHLLKKGKISLIETVNRQYNTPQLSNSEFYKSCSVDDEIVLPDLSNSKVGWSHNLNKGVFTANTIAFIGCQIAAYLKVKNVFILGMDLGSAGTNQSRSYETGADARPTTIDKDYETAILPAFQLLSTIELNTSFYNISLNSRLPASVMPKLSLNDALVLTSSPNTAESHQKNS